MSWDQGSRKTFGAMIEDKIDLFRDTPPSLIEKEKKVAWSPIPKVDTSIMSIQVTPFCCPVFGKFAL